MRATRETVQLMSIEEVLYLVVFLFWLTTSIQGAASIYDGLRFDRYVRRALEAARGLFDENGVFQYQPPASVIMPCKGVDEKLNHTVDLLSRQHYGDYEVVFAFESDTDPAYVAVKTWTASWTKPYKMVVAGLASECSQKIHNLLAALRVIGADREVLVFVDSDAEPAVDWLGHIVAPLQDDHVGASTGYRWYVASGGVAAGVRCAWNAATTVTLHNDRMNFCWGGSTAMRRERFESLEIARHWRRALSDDLQVTRQVRRAGLRICFVPQAFVTSSDATTLAGFKAFAHRQVVISRICVPEIWRWGLLYCTNFMLGTTGVVLLSVAGMLGLLSNDKAMWLALCGWATIVVLVVIRAVLRQVSLRRILGSRLTWRDFCWDVFGTMSVAGPMHSFLIFSSIFTRRFLWRDVEYEMISPDETRIVGRQ